MELWRLIEIRQWLQNFPDVWCSTTRNQITKRHGHIISLSFHMWKIPHHQQSFLFFQAKPHEKKWSEERTGSASPVPNPDCEKSESYIMFVNSFPNLNRDTFGGGFFRKDLQNWSYFQDSLYVDSYWSVDVRNWEFLPQLQTYKLCTGLRPHQGLNFRFSKSWWETLGRVTGERLLGFLKHLLKKTGTYDQNSVFLNPRCHPKMLAAIC